MQTLNRTVSYSLAIAGALAVSGWSLAAADAPVTEEKTVQVVVAGSPDIENTNGLHERLKTIVVKGIEPVHAGHPFGKEVPWLGVATDEAPEVLTAQLGLDPGVGLVVNYVATNSPAAKAGLQKNDVLVEFENQSLVHPAQLRKLVQARKESDTVKLVYYHAGKKETTTVTLGKTSALFGLFGEENSWSGDLKELQLRLHDLPPIGDALREQMQTLRKSLGDMKIDQKKVQVEIQRGMKEAQKALHEAMKQATNAGAAFGPAAKALKDLEKLGVNLDNKTTVTVRNSGKSVKNIVKSDGSGTIAIVSSPKLHLTAHDKDGKLLFDGEIETPEQRAKVPPEVWKQAEPLLEKMKSNTPEEEQEEVEEDAAAPQVPAARGGGDFVLSSGLLGSTRML